MKLKWNLMAVLITAILLVAVAPLAAQTSNTNKATSTIFGSDVDNYLSVTDFGSVTMDKWFAFTNIAATDPSTGARALDLGYAQKVGALYFGAYYNGAILVQAASQIREDSITTPTYDANQILTTTTTEKTKSLTDKDSVTSNRGNVMVGVAGMGFKLGFDEKLTTRTAPSSWYDAYTNTSGTFATTSDITTVSNTNVVTSKVYSGLSSVSGYMTPSIQWGTNFALGKLTLVPNVTAALQINKYSNGYSYKESTTENGTAVLGTSTISRSTAVANDYLEPNINLGVTLKGEKVDGAQAQVSLAYNLDLSVYGSDGLKTTYKASNVTHGELSSLTTTFEGLYADKRTAATHTVTPVFTFTKDLTDRASVGYNVGAAIKYASTSSKQSWESTTTTVYDKYTSNPADDYTQVEVYSDPVQSGSYVTDTLTVNPSLNAGFVYKIVPSKFDIKGGVNVKAPQLTSTHTVYNDAEPITDVTTKTDGNGYVTKYIDASDLNSTRDEYSTLDTTWGALNYGVYFGSTFNFTDKFALDLAGYLGTNGQASLMGTANGLLTQSLSLSFTIKN